MMNSKTSSAASSKPAAQEKDDPSDSDSAGEIPGVGDESQMNFDDESSRIRREKRLAMNRESARARRKRKKILIETLEHQVSELTKSNKSYRLRVEDLEKELSAAKNTIQVLSSASHNTPNTTAVSQPQLRLGSGFLPDHGQLAQVLSRPPLEEDHSATLRRVLQSQSSLSSNSLAESQLMGFNGGVGMGLHPSLSHNPNLSSAQSLAAGVSMDPLGSSQGVAARFGMAARGQQSAFIGQPSPWDEQIAREQRLLLARQQHRSAAMASSASEQPNPSATVRALFMQQMLQDNNTDLSSPK